MWALGVRQPTQPLVAPQAPAAKAVTEEIVTRDTLVETYHRSSSSTSTDRTQLRRPLRLIRPRCDIRPREGRGAALGRPEAAAASSGSSASAVLRGEAALQLAPASHIGVGTRAAVLQRGGA